MSNVESIVAREMDKLFTLRKFFGKPLNPMVVAGTEVVQIVGTTTSKEIKSAADGIINNQIKRGVKPVLFLAEAFVQDPVGEQRADAFIVKVFTGETVRTFMQTFSQGTRGAIKEVSYSSW